MDEGNNDFDFDFMPIGQAIKKAREARGMIREQLAGIIGYAHKVTVVFIGPSNIDSLHKAMSFNGMDSASEVDLLAVTFPDNELFTGDKSIAIETLKQQHPNDDNLPEELY